MPIHADPDDETIPFITCISRFDREQALDSGSAGFPLCRDRASDSNGFVIGLLAVTKEGRVGSS